MRQGKSITESNRRAEDERVKHNIMSKDFGREGELPCFHHENVPVNYLCGTAGARRKSLFPSYSPSAPKRPRIEVPKEPGREYKSKKRRDKLDIGITPAPEKSFFGEITRFCLADFCSHDVLPRPHTWLCEAHLIVSKINVAAPRNSE